MRLLTAVVVLSSTNDAPARKMLALFVDVWAPAAFRTKEPLLMSIRLLPILAFCKKSVLRPTFVIVKAPVIAPVSVILPAPGTRLEVPTLLLAFKAIEPAYEALVALLLINAPSVLE